jgi:aspartate/methionine/tyrosine aminotransferase
MTVRIENVGQAVRQTQYAVRGPIGARAQELERQGRAIIYCNIGNPQSRGQRPLTRVRQVLALVECPALIATAAAAFPADAVAAARTVLDGTGGHGSGAYTESKGLLFVRQAIAAFIGRRDAIPADPEAIFLSDGASKAAQGVLHLLVSGPKDGILIPTPQYPLYSATITLLGGRQVPYLLDEAHDWRLDRAELERAVADARAKGITPRAIVVINPGNPTGGVLAERDVEMVLDFARAHDLAVLADEVYQENVYGQGERFCSFASALERRRMADVSLFSFHSVSKGLLGECGHRGGYVECRNVPDEVMAEFVKLQSVALCSNTTGQIVTWLMVTPPPEGGPSRARWEAERREIFETLARRARLVEEGLNAVPGIRCNRVAGAMYAFPSITLPTGMTDEAYCLRLLEETGICVVPGTGFGQATGTWHFRTTILPPIDQIEAVVKRIGAFHLKVSGG